MKVLWIVHVWPEGDSSAGGVRTLQLLRFFLDRGDFVSVVSPCRSSEYRRALEDLGIETAHIEINDSAFDDFIAHLSPDMVFFDRFIIEEQFGWRVQRYSPRSVRVLDTIDLHFVRKERQLLVGEERGFGLSEKVITSSDTMLREVSSIFRCDHSLLVSEWEKQLLVNEYCVPETLLSVCPIYYGMDGKVSLFESREHMVAIGNFNHEPNVDCFRLLRDAIWPQVHTLFVENYMPHVELHIYGAYATHEFSHAKNLPKGMIVKGRAREVVSTLKQYRLTLAPLRFGAGIKGKVLDSWSAGTPVITTQIGLEGLEIEDAGTNLPPCNFEVSRGFTRECESKENLMHHSITSPEAFIQACYLLYNDKERWMSSQLLGYDVLRRSFLLESVRAKFTHCIDRIILNRETHRASNVVGKMLWFNTARCTEYFSRWLELKAKG
jgi:O-antigen biosynthesis protein